MKFLKNLFKRKPEHDRELFVLRNGYAFVKCKRCGMESIPWTVNKKEAEGYCDRHPEQIKMLVEIDQNKVAGACRD
jgi:hypothetical protein